MNKFVYLFVGFATGIIITIILKILCKNRRQRVSMIVPRCRRVQNIQVIPQQILVNNDSIHDFSISNEPDKECRPKELHVRFSENV